MSANFKHKTPAVSVSLRQRGFLEYWHHCDRHMNRQLSEIHTVKRSLPYFGCRATW